MSEEKMIETIKQIIEFTEDVCIYETENKTMKEFLNYIDNSISKDKIRELKEKWNKSIKWNNADDHYYAMKMLEELLGE